MVGCARESQPRRTSAGTTLAVVQSEGTVRAKNNEKQNEHTDNGHQKTVSGKNQHGPDEKLGKDAGGNAGSRGQNSRGGNSGADGKSVGSHKPGGDGPGTKTFKHEHDRGDSKRGQ